MESANIPQVRPHSKASSAIPPSDLTQRDLTTAVDRRWEVDRREIDSRRPLSEKSRDVVEFDAAGRRIRHDSDIHRGGDYYQGGQGDNGQYCTAVESVGSRYHSPMVERHPERLMQGYGGDPAPIRPDTGNIYREKYQRKSSGTSTQQLDRERERDIYPEGDNFIDPANKQHLDPNSAASRTGRTRQKLENILRNDSLSSDLSDCVRPSPPKPHKPRKGKKQSSMSSSEDEMLTTPEGTSWEDQEIESESISEKGTFCM